MFTESLQELIYPGAFYDEHIVHYGLDDNWDHKRRIVHRLERTVYESLIEVQSQILLTPIGLVINTERDRRSASERERRLVRRRCELMLILTGTSEWPVVYVS